MDAPVLEHDEEGAKLEVRDRVTAARLMGTTRGPHIARHLLLLQPWVDVQLRLVGLLPYGQRGLLGTLWPRHGRAEATEGSREHRAHGGGPRRGEALPLALLVALRGGPDRRGGGPCGGDQRVGMVRGRGDQRELGVARAGRSSGSRRSGRGLPRRPCDPWLGRRGGGHVEVLLRPTREARATKTRHGRVLTAHELDHIGALLERIIDVKIAEPSSQF
mmetsp:Transcript_92573/g.248274  ORF Transcript_92573/g.248274 Transcript_92573/m.248274 type:complete len:218 (+) Transcript_92573:604-1257(+)